MMIKVCGITCPEDARRAADLGADAIGMVFWPGSPRAVTPAAAAEIASAVNGRVLRVGVFVDAAPDDVREVVRRSGLDAVQLHGDEAPDAFRGVGAPMIKAVALDGPADVEAAVRLPDDVTVLVDARDSRRRGGTGRQADWLRAAELAAKRRVWLAGGLTAANVADAVRRVRPAGLDVSSGVESEPGVKDPARVAAFVAAARAALKELP